MGVPTPIFRTQYKPNEKHTGRSSDKNPFFRIHLTNFKIRVRGKIGNQFERILILYKDSTVSIVFL
ncbi:hypothetical protein CH380_07140 [Leptospira adleri]|uniref:Uncharacterized protein n=1 Tax=Leptospira adleri TaxID=2023186 RepID=A0A2M9YQG9_9LEPT|nr:hypothetical protein CH380_07140 [Leptospira adleri]PJZ61059.1 hypothetical protein CH376_15260 [Leptospira adleri]